MKMSSKTGTKTPEREQALQAFDKLLTIMDELREKCPWDREQTIKSIRNQIGRAHV